MKKKIKSALKKNPFVEKCVEYRDYHNRKKSLHQVLQNISKRQQERGDSLKQQPLVSIIILNRNGMDKLKDLMESFKKSDFYSNFEIVFVDNASTDASVEYMKGWSDTYNIQIICNAENRSFSAGNNQGAELAKGDYLLFLNNDIAVTDGWLDELLLAMEDVEHPGAIGARLVYPKALGNKQVKGQAYAVQHRGIAFKDTMRQKQHFIRPYNMGSGEPAELADDKIVERIAVMAAAFLVKKSVFESVGGFSEEYTYGLEDVDFCLKLHQKGYKNYYCPNSVIYHYEFGTRDKGESLEAKQRGNHNVSVFQGRWQKYLAKEMLLDKLDGRQLFTTSPLQIAIAYNQSEKSSELLQLEKQLKNKGYKVLYLNRKDERKYYSVTAASDVLLILDQDYKLDNIANYKSDLLVFKVQEDTEGCGDVACVSMKTLLQNEDWLKSRLLELTKDQVNEKEIDIFGCMPKDDTMKFWGDLHFAVAMKKEFEKRGYVANVKTRMDWYQKSSAKYTIFLRGNKEFYPAKEEGKYKIMWNISHPEEVSLSEYNSFDYVFFASDKLKSKMGADIQCESGVVMQCTDAEVMKAQVHVDKKYDLLFVGNSRHVYRQILKDLLPTEHKLTVIGRHWEEYPVQEYVVQPFISNDEVGQAYHDAKILLNDHWDDMKEQGVISNRIYDALAVGAFVVSDYMPEIEEYFGDTVVTYADKEDLKEKIDYYMQHEEERMDKARRGQEIVLREHTFANRIEKMIQVMEKM